jgi:hypothetical protein
MNNYKAKSSVVLLVLGVMLFAAPVSAADTDDLRAMLDDFLANVTKADTHDRFWAEDLIYTSSSGARTMKSDIMSGFSTSDSADNDGAPAGPIFTAEEVQIQVYNETAVVAFKLVATPPTGSEVLGMQKYFNTGTFVKRDGEWRAVAWQATIIPD